jgi:hypothetical protein
MDHRPPMTFEVNVTTFLESRGLSLEGVTLTHGADEQVAPIVTDQTLVEAFREWHARLARIRITLVALPKSPMSFASGDEFPQISTPKPRRRPSEF